MFDLSRITELVSGALGPAAEGAEAGGLIGQLQELGIDPGQLSEMAPEQLTALLNEHGIDLANLDPAQLSALVEQFGGENATGGIMDVLMERLGTK